MHFAGEAVPPSKIRSKEGAGTINLENKDYEVPRGAGVYLGPSETATVKAGQAELKLFDLEVPQIPK